MCGNELNLVDSFSVMSGWVEPALSKKWLCLLVLSADNLCKQFRSIRSPRYWRFNFKLSKIRIIGSQQGHNNYKWY